jgi:photosystem II stability/assembly factor-like uncharacterized protein
VGLVLLTGTRKGLFVLRGDESRRSFDLEGPYLPGWSINHATVDSRDGTLYACTNNWVYGASVHRSSDGGETWARSEGLGLPEESGLKLAATWHLEPGHASQPGTLWLGGDPGALFRSDDGGVTWAVNEGVLTHPTRERWHPGAGGLCTHSITLDPDDPDRLWIGISAAGVFRTDDGGASWTAANTGTEACFLPEDTYPEVGQCVHKVLAHPAGGGVMWQQNHCGVYRSADGGDSWTRLEDNGLPSGFGFPIALDPNDADVAYVVPEHGPEHRVTCDGRLGVYRTTDRGESWELHAEGLPERAWASIKREGMAFDDGHVYLATQGGSVYALDRSGGTWLEAVRDLPEILSLEAGWL